MKSCIRAPIAQLMLFIFTSSLIANHVNAQADPGQFGPFPVGVTTIQLDDHNRIDPESAGPRQLLTEIWYPASDVANTMPSNKYSEFILRGVGDGFVEAAEEGLNGYREGLGIEELDRTFNNQAVRDAPVRDGKWPLILFSHGSGGTRVGYIYFVEHMASHGYVVMAADHTGNARFTFLDGKVVKRGGERAENSASDRPKDISFLLDSMIKMNAGNDSRFAGRVKTEQVGAAGMSFGGSTSINVLSQDPRIKAGVLMAPGGPVGERSNTQAPILMLIGTEDSTIGESGNEANRQYYENSTGPRYLVEIPDGGHFTFTSVNQYNPEFGNGFGSGTRISNNEPLDYLDADEGHNIINSYALAFFNVYLQDMKEYEDYLGENHFADKIKYRH